MRSRSRLFFQEWFVFLSIILFVFSVFPSSFFGVFRSSSFLAIEEGGLVSVCVEGSVDRPGVYQVMPGQSLKDILTIAGLRPVADKKTVYMKKTVVGSCEIQVSDKKRKKRGK
jgi:hypothetical protein